MLIYVIKGPSKLIPDQEFSMLKESFNKKGIHCIDFRIEDLNLEIIDSKLLINGGSTPLPDLVLIRNPILFKKDIKKFEDVGIPCVNSSTAIQNSRMKLDAANILNDHQVPVPKTIPFTENLNDIVSSIGFPFIIKPYPSSLGLDVWLCRNEEDFFKFLPNANKISSGQKWLVQEFIEHRYKEVVRSFVIDHKVVFALHKTYSPEDVFVNTSILNRKFYPITDDLINISIKTTKALNIEIAGIDLLYDKDGMKVCEVNCSPFFIRAVDTHPALNVADIIVDYVSDRYLK